MKDMFNFGLNFINRFVSTAKSKERTQKEVNSGVCTFIMDKPEFIAYLRDVLMFDGLVDETTPIKISSVFYSGQRKSKDVFNLDSGFTLYFQAASHNLTHCFRGFERDGIKYFYLSGGRYFSELRLKDIKDAELFELISSCVAELLMERKTAYVPS